MKVLMQTGMRIRVVQKPGKLMKSNLVLENQMLVFLHLSLVLMTFLVSLLQKLILPNGVGYQFS